MIVGIFAVALIGIRGLLGVAGIMAIYSDPSIAGFVSLVLLGTGAGAIAISGPGALAATAPRSGLILFAIGCFSIVLLLASAQEIVPGSLGGGSSMIVVGGAGLLAPIGLLMIGVTLVRSSGLATIAGLFICVGGLLAVLGLFSSSVLGYDISRGILFFGTSIVGAGLLGVGLLACGVGQSPSGEVFKARRKMPEDC